MSMLEPTGNAAFDDAGRIDLQLSSNDRRIEVNFDTQRGERIPKRHVESEAAHLQAMASNVCSDPCCNQARSVMRSASDHAADYVAALKVAVGLIQEDLLRVESILTEQMGIESTTREALTLQSMLDYVKELGGKRLRPSLALLVARACGSITPETVRLAAAIELVHTATLVHDDIIDDAGERRHRPTAHMLWGAHQSVLIGDWLFTHAYELANLGESTLPGRWISRAAKRVCEGEIRQGQSLGRTNLTEEEYFDILDAKTGALCEVSCRLGAWSAGADQETIEAFAAFGSKLGIAFQIYDDWLDVWGDPASAGKTLGTDLLSLKPTLPTIFALHCDSTGAFQSRWLNREFHSQGALRMELDPIEASQYTRDKANQIGAEAIRSIEAIAQEKQLDAPSIEALSRLAFCATHRSA